MTTIKIKTSVSTLETTYTSGKTYEVPDVQAQQWVNAGIAIMETSASTPKPTRRKRK